MKRVFIAGFMVLLAVGVYAGTELRDACRQIIYAVKPVDLIMEIENDTLRTLARYALGISVEGQEKLSDSDSWLFSFLANTEFTRRSKTPNEFSLYLQERHEYLDPFIKGKGNVTDYIKADGWLDLYKLKLITG